MGKSFGTPEQFRSAIENKIDELEMGGVSSSTDDLCAHEAVEGSENLSVRDAKNKELEDAECDFDCVTC